MHRPDHQDLQRWYDQYFSFIYFFLKGYFPDGHLKIRRAKESFKWETMKEFFLFNRKVMFLLEN